VPRAAFSPPSPTLVSPSHPSLPLPLPPVRHHQVRDSVAIHVPCSSKKMGIEESFAKLAGLCANEVGVYLLLGLGGLGVQGV
jgi:hypothetical protein